MSTESNAATRAADPLPGSADLPGAVLFADRFSLFAAWLKRRLDGIDTRLEALMATDTANTHTLADSLATLHAFADQQHAYQEQRKQTDATVIGVLSTLETHLATIEQQTAAAGVDVSQTVAAMRDELAAGTTSLNELAAAAAAAATATSAPVAATTDTSAASATT